MNDMSPLSRPSSGRDFVSTGYAKQSLTGGPDIFAVVAIVATVILTLASAGQWLGIGPDYLEYEKFVDSVTPYLRVGYSRFEPGFEFVTWFFVQIMDRGVFSLFLVLCGLALSIKFYLIRCYTHSPMLAAIAYVFLFYPLHEYIQIRVAVAVAFSYLGVMLMLERRYVWAAVAALIGALFQSSSIIIIIVAAVGVFGSLPVIAGSSLLLLVTASSLNVFGFITQLFVSLNPLAEGYLTNAVRAGEVNVFSITNILWLLSLMSITALGNVQPRTDRFDRCFLTLFIGGFVFLIAFQGSPVVAQRLKELLFVGPLFLVFRRPLSWNTAPGMALMLLNGAVFTYAQFSNGVIG